MKISRRDTLFILFSLGLVTVMAGPLRALIAFALDTENTHASQIVLIPFITATLIFLNRRKIFESIHYSVAPGVVLMIAGIGLFAAGKTVGVQLKEGDDLALLTSSIVLLWLGGFLLFYGTTAFRMAVFPLMFLVFFIPIPSAILDRTITFLQRGSAEMAYILLRISGTPVLRESAYIFRMPDLVIEVAPACSGIRSGISLLISSLLAGHLFLRSTWRRGLLVLVAIPVLLFKNALRIGTLSYLAVHVDRRFLEGELHREGGTLFFVLALILLYPVLAILMKSENKAAGKDSGTPVTLKPVTMSDTKFGHY